MRRASPPAPGRPLLLVNMGDDLLRECVVGVLKGAGYRLAVGDDGRKALRYSRTLLPDLLLMDLFLPRLNAWHVFQQLRRDPRMSRVKFLLVCDPEDGEEICPGADGFLSFSFGPDDLTRMVRELVGPPLARESGNRPG